MFQKLRHILLSLLFLLIHNCIFSEGFIAGTLVRTQNGYIPIEQLKVNDCVTSYSFKNKQLFESKILKINKKLHDKAIKLKINGSEIVTAPDHKFYVPLHQNKKWLKAQELKPKDFILRNIKDLTQIDEIVELNGESEFYSLSIDKYHNFFISNQDFFVHNEIVLGTLCGIEFFINVAPVITGGIFCLCQKIFCKNKPYLDDSTIFKSALIGQGVQSIYQAAKAPGKPTEEDGFEEKKNSNGQKKPHPKTGQRGYPDRSNDYWVPSGEPAQGGHGGPHWDIIDQDGNHVANVYPGGKVRK